MAKIPDSGPFSFSDVIAEFGTVVEAAGKDKNLMSSYAGVAEGIPANPPFKLSDFKGKASELVLRSSEYFALYPNNTAWPQFSIVQLFWNFFTNASSPRKMEISELQAIRAFRFIIDEDYTDMTFTTGSVQSSIGTFSIGIHGFYLLAWGTNSKITIQVDGSVTGKHHGPAVANSGTGYGISLTASSLTEASNYTSGGGEARPALIAERDFNLKHVSGTLQGGDGAGGDVRIKLLERYNGQRITTVYNEKIGNSDSAPVAFTNLEASVECILQGVRNGQGLTGFVFGTTNNDGDFNIYSDLVSMVQLVQYGQNDRSAQMEFSFSDFIYSAGRRGTSRSLQWAEHSWAVKGLAGGYDKIVGVVRTFTGTVIDTGITPVKSKGTSQTTVTSQLTVSSVEPGRDAVEENGFTITIED